MALQSDSPPPLCSGWRTALKDGFRKHGLSKKPLVMFVNRGDLRDYLEWMWRIRPDLKGVEVFKGVDLEESESMAPGECEVVWQ